MLKFRNTSAAGDDLAVNSVLDGYLAASRRVPQLQNDNDLRTPTSPLEKPRLGIEARRQLRAELFGPMQEAASSTENVYNANTPSTRRGQAPPLTRVDTLISAKPSKPIDIHAAIIILKELKKTATTEDLVALHRALLPEIATQQPQPEPGIRPVDTVPPHNAEIRRRRSLFKPGEATRTQSLTPPKAASTPQSSSMQYPKDILHDATLLSPPELPGTLTARTATPSDLGRTYLGNYKIGSLHITNGSASPRPTSRLQQVRNPSATTSEREDDYYTASEGSVGRKEENNRVYQDDATVPNLNIVEQSTDQYIDGSAEGKGEPSESPADLERTYTVIRHNRPGFCRRPTDEDTIASTGSKYSYDPPHAANMEIAEDPFFIPNATNLSKHSGSDAVWVRGSRVSSILPPERVDWVEDVEPQFLEFNGKREDAFTELSKLREFSKAELPNSQLPFSALVPPQTTMVYYKRTEMLELPRDKQEVLRDSGYGADVLLQAHLQSLPTETQSSNHIWSTQVFQSEEEQQLVNSNNDHQQTPAPILLKTISAMDMTVAEVFPEVGIRPGDRYQRRALSSSAGHNTSQMRSATRKGQLTLDNCSPGEGSVPTSQRKKPVVARAVSTPIVVQRQRSISECPYLPDEVISKHSERLHRSPGMDHLDRTYKTVAHSGSCDSIATLESFHPVEVRFPSPTPDSAANSRGRKTRRFSGGPLHSATRLFRSRSRKDTMMGATSESVLYEAASDEVTALGVVAASAGNSVKYYSKREECGKLPNQTGRIASEKRRVPSGPRAMTSSSNVCTPQGPVRGMSEQAASQLALTRSRDRRPSYARKPSTPEPGAVQHVQHAQQQEGVSQQHNMAKATESSMVNSTHISIMERPRGWRYDARLRSPIRLETDQLDPMTIPTQRRHTINQDELHTQPDLHTAWYNPERNGPISPPPRSESRPVHTSNRPTQVLNETTPNKLKAEEIPTPRSLPPSRDPPGPPVPPKLRPTIRRVESSPERPPRSSPPKAPHTPVRLSVPIATTQLSGSPSPPTRAPPLPPKLVIHNEVKAGHIKSELRLSPEVGARHRRITLNGMEGQWLKGNVDQ